MAAKKKRVTLLEFKAWLEGVEELQPKDWSPTSDQWALIRAKIINIKEEPPVAAPPMVLPVQSPPMQQNLMANGIRPAPPTPSIPVGDIEMSPAAKGMLKGGTMPNLPPESQDGNYESTFS